MKLILIVWRANSGKTTLANHIAEHFWIKRISASDYTKSLTWDHSRKSLETVFNNIISKNWYEYLAQKTIEFAFKWEKFAIIDGLRHIDFLEAFRKILWNENCFCIWIDIDKQNRFLLAKKAHRRESQDYNIFCDYEKNSTHESLADKIFSLSDIKIQNDIIHKKSLTYWEIINKVKNFLEN